MHARVFIVMTLQVEENRFLEVPLKIESPICEIKIIYIPDFSTLILFNLEGLMMTKLKFFLSIL